MTERSENISLSFVILSRLLIGILRLMAFTWRFRVEGANFRQEAVAAHPQGALIIALWHENIIASILGHVGQPFAPMVSRSRDGEFVAFVLSSLGMSSIRGSSSRGGAAALMEVKQFLAKGGYTALAVDGPRGPRRVSKPGIVEAARFCGTPILPLAAVPSQMWTVKSWDRFRIPKPFAHITVRYGKPIFVPREAKGDDFEAYRRSVEDGLNAIDILGTERLP